MHMLTGPCLDFTKVTRTKKKFLCSTTLLLPSLPNRRFFCECCNSVVESYTFFVFASVAKRGKPFVFSDIPHGIKEQKVVVYQVINQNSGDFLQKRLPRKFLTTSGK